MVASNPTIPIITLNTNKLKLHLKEIGRKQNPALCFLQETDCFFGCAAQYWELSSLTRDPTCAPCIGSAES